MRRSQWQDWPVSSDWRPDAVNVTCLVSSLLFVSDAVAERGGRWEWLRVARWPPSCKVYIPDASGTSRFPFLSSLGWDRSLISEKNQLSLSPPNPGTKYSQTCHSKDDRNPYPTLWRKYSLPDIPKKLRICKCVQLSENEPGQFHSHSLTVVGVRIPVFNFFKMAQLKCLLSTEMLKSHILQAE